MQMQMYSWSKDALNEFVDVSRAVKILAKMTLSPPIISAADQLWLSDWSKRPPLRFEITASDDMVARSGRQLT